LPSSPFALYPSFLFPFPSRAKRVAIFFFKNGLLSVNLAMSELPIIQKTYDLVKWYVPILNRLPRQYKFTVGDRMIIGLYELLEGLISARYARDKLAQLEALNVKIDTVRELPWSHTSPLCG
jgi:hypothetical protein